MRAGKLRLAVIGCSFFAQNHLHAWLEIPQVEIVAVCDRASLRVIEVLVDGWAGDRLDGA